MNQALTKAIEHWRYIAPIVAYPKNEKEFDALISRLDELLDRVNNNENHPLMGLIDMISHIIATYEEEHYQVPKSKGIDALKFIMNAHQLHQSDFPEIGSQGVVSEILNEKRSLNLRHIKLLAKRFNVSQSTFIDG